MVIRPASVYGPGHYRGGSGGGKNMAELARQCLGNGPIEIYEKRVGSNDFVYAKDVGRGVAQACTAKVPPARRSTSAPANSTRRRIFIAS